MPKNIVLLSDGTGNSAASPFKTNVWRLYQAVDITEPQPQSGLRRQIMAYDNGVGTESFKPLAALGGAFGIGVWQNVKDLYTFVCRNYVHDDDDYIFGFGFSRGAFTMRLLMGLIGKCGIVKAISDAELDRCVQMAYEAYRRDFLIRASRQRGMIYHHILTPPKYRQDNGQTTAMVDLSGCGCVQHFPDIRFIGVWDTVDAYGMPVDELKFAIDDWVWPMSFADRDPSKRLLTIRHALSLDDERPTFRPVLWNEVIKDPEDPKNEKKWQRLSQNTIQQVWFAGVHANVGGGYPDDGLAFAALDWMMAEAEGQGLRFVDWIRTEVKARANPQGEQYDSRSGVAGYYRYGPRKVGELCADDQYNVHVPVVRVYPAVFQRIVAREQKYAPVSLGVLFDVNGAKISAPDPVGLEAAWDMVWWRRFAYFTTLELSAFVSLFFLRLVFDWPNCILEFTEAKLQKGWSYVTWILGEKLTGWISRGWDFLLSQADKVLPSWAAPTVPSFADYPLSGIVSLALLAFVFFFWASQLQNKINIHAEWAWHQHKGLIPQAQPKLSLYNTIGRKIRPVTAWLYKVWLKGLVFVLGVAVGVIAFVILSPYWLFRVARRRRPWMA